MNKVFILVVLFAWNFSYAQIIQDTTAINQLQQNAAQTILSNSQGKRVTIGAYGEINYNQPEGDNGELDVQRLVVLLDINLVKKCSSLLKLNLSTCKKFLWNRLLLIIQLGTM